MMAHYSAYPPQQHYEQAPVEQQDEGITADDVAGAFCFQYFRVLRMQPLDLYRFYGEDSRVTRGSTAQAPRDYEHAKGLKQIQMLAYRTGKEAAAATVEIKTITAQEYNDGSVIIHILGKFKYSEVKARYFNQTVFLARKSLNPDGGYYVSNDIFLYLDEDEIVADRSISEQPPVADHITATISTSLGDDSKPVAPPVSANATPAAAPVPKTIAPRLGPAPGSPEAEVRNMGAHDATLKGEGSSSSPGMQPPAMMQSAAPFVSAAPEPAVEQMAAQPQSAVAAPAIEAEEAPEPEVSAVADGPLVDNEVESGPELPTDAENMRVPDTTDVPSDSIDEFSAPKVASLRDAVQEPASHQSGYEEPDSEAPTEEPAKAAPKMAWNMSQVKKTQEQKELLRQQEELMREQAQPQPAPTHATGVSLTEATEPWKKPVQQTVAAPPVSLQYYADMRTKYPPGSYAGTLMKDGVRTVPVKTGFVIPVREESGSRSNGSAPVSGDSAEAETRVDLKAEARKTVLCTKVQPNISDERLFSAVADALKGQPSEGRAVEIKHVPNQWHRLVTLDTEMAARHLTQKGTFFVQGIEIRVERPSREYFQQDDHEDRRNGAPRGGARGRPSGFTRGRGGRGGFVGRGGFASDEQTGGRSMRQRQQPQSPTAAQQQQQQQPQQPQQSGPDEDGWQSVDRSKRAPGREGGVRGGRPSTRARRGVAPLAVV